MNMTPTLSVAGASVAGPPVASGAWPGAQAQGGQLLVGLVQRMLRTGMAMARCINRIAWQRLAGEDLARLAPKGFNPTRTNARIVEAVAWTAALRERLFALTARPRLAPGMPKAERGPRARGPASYLPDGPANPVAGDRNDWKDLARPWRMGPGGVAFAARMMAGLSDREVVGRICDNLGLAASELGASADIGRIAALEAAARALCPEPVSAATTDDGGATVERVVPVARTDGGQVAGRPPADAGTKARPEPPPPD